MAVSLQVVYVWCNIGTGKLSADNRDVLSGCAGTVSTISLFMGVA